MGDLGGGGLKGAPGREERDECRDLVKKRKRHPGLESRRESCEEGELDSCERGRTRLLVLNSCG